MKEDTLKPALTDEELKATLGTQGDEFEILAFNAMSDIEKGYGSSCGGTGRNIGLRNKTQDRRIRVYYVVTSNMTSPSQGNRIIGPGQIAWICCSAPGGGQWFNVEVTGAVYE